MNESGVPDRCRSCEVFFDDFEELKSLENEKWHIENNRDELEARIESADIDLYLVEIEAKIKDVELRIQGKQFYTEGCPGAKINQVILDDEHMSVLECRSTHLR